MSRLDDRLTHELERIARPADPAQAFERVDRRRSRMHIRRRIQSAGLVAWWCWARSVGSSYLSDAFHGGGTDGREVGHTDPERPRHDAFRSGRHRARVPGV